MTQNTPAHKHKKPSKPKANSRRWIRTPQETTELLVVDGEKSRDRLANCSVRLVSVLYVVRPHSIKVEYLIRLQSKRGRRITKRLSHEQLCDEKAFLQAMPPGFSLSSRPKAFLKLRECLMNDVMYANHEANVESLGWFRWQGQAVFAHAAGLIRSDNSPQCNSFDSGHGTSQAVELLDLDQACSVVPILGCRHRCITKVTVNLPDQLAGYRLSIPETDREVKAAMRAVVELLSIGDPNVTYPLISTVFFTAVRDPRFGVFLYGETGSMKSAFALLMLSFFVPGASEKDVASLLSTEKGLLARFQATANGIVIMDDYVEKSGAVGGGSEAKKLDNVLRPTLNGVSRDACNGDGSLRPKDRPRGLPVLTGEALSSGLQSLMERMIKIPIEKETFAASAAAPRPNRFDEFQEMAKGGVFTKAMAGFIKWIANDFELFQRFIDNPQHGLETGTSLHLRQIDAVGDILSGASLMLTFAKEIGAISEEEFDEHQGNSVDAVYSLMERAQLDALEDCSTEAFAHCLQAALASKRCHIQIENIQDFVETFDDVPLELLGYTVEEIQVPKPSHDDEDEPKQSDDENKETAERKKETEETGAGKDSKQNEIEYVTKTVYSPNGPRIGWTDFEIVDLIPIACLVEVNKMATRSGMQAFPAPKVFGKELFNKSWLARHSKGRNTYKSRHDGIILDGWRIHLFRLFEYSIPVGTFDAESYKAMTALERRRKCHERRLNFTNELREKLSRYQVDELLNPHLTEADRKQLRPEVPVPGEDAIHDPHRITPHPPGVERLPGYSEEIDDEC